MAEAKIVYPNRKPDKFVDSYGDQLFFRNGALVLFKVAKGEQAVMNIKDIPLFITFLQESIA